MAIKNDKIFKHDIKILERCDSKRGFDLKSLLVDSLIIVALVSLLFFIVWFLLGQIIELAARL